jgi:hypothetical protein
MDNPPIKVKTNLSDFFKSGEGKYSSARLGFLVWTMAVLGIWIYVSIASKALSDIPQGVRWIVGILMAGGTTQRWLENNPTMTIGSGNKPPTQ